MLLVYSATDRLLDDFYKLLVLLKIFICRVVIPGKQVSHTDIVLYLLFGVNPILVDLLKGLETLRLDLVCVLMGQGRMLGLGQCGD